MSLAQFFRYAFESRSDVISLILGGFWPSQLVPLPHGGEGTIGSGGFREKPCIDMADIQSHRAVVVGDAASQHKGLVEVDEVGIAAEGLGKDIGFEDGCCILKRDKFHELVMGGDHSSACDAPADHGGVLSTVLCRHVEY